MEQHQRGSQIANYIRQFRSESPQTNQQRQQLEIKQFWWKQKKRYAKFSWDVVADANQESPRQSPQQQLCSKEEQSDNAPQSTSFENNLITKYLAYGESQINAKTEQPPYIRKSSNQLENNTVTTEHSLTVLQSQTLDNKSYDSSPQNIKFETKHVTDSQSSSSACLSIGAGAQGQTNNRINSSTTVQHNGNQYHDVVPSSMQEANYIEQKFIVQPIGLDQLSQSRCDTQFERMVNSNQRSYQTPKTQDRYENSAYQNQHKQSCQQDQQDQLFSSLRSSQDTSRHEELIASKYARNDSTDEVCSRVQEQHICTQQPFQPLKAQNSGKFERSKDGQAPTSDNSVLSPVLREAAYSNAELAATEHSSHSITSNVQCIPDLNDKLVTGNVNQTIDQQQYSHSPRSQSPTRSATSPQAASKDSQKGTDKYNQILMQNQGQEIRAPFAQKTAGETRVGSGSLASPCTPVSESDEKDPQHSLHSPQKLQQTELLKDDSKGLMSASSSDDSSIWNAVQYSNNRVSRFTSIQYQNRQNTHYSDNNTQQKVSNLSIGGRLQRANDEVLISSVDTLDMEVTKITNKIMTPSVNHGLNDQQSYQLQQIDGQNAAQVDCCAQSPGNRARDAECVEHVSTQGLERGAPPCLQIEQSTLQQHEQTNAQQINHGGGGGYGQQSTALVERTGSLKSDTLTTFLDQDASATQADSSERGSGTSQSNKQQDMGSKVDGIVDQVIPVSQSSNFSAASSPQVAQGSRVQLNRQTPKTPSTVKSAQRSLNRSPSPLSREFLRDSPSVSQKSGEEGVLMLETGVACHAKGSDANRSDVQCSLEYQDASQRAVSQPQYDTEDKIVELQQGYQEQSRVQLRRGAETEVEGGNGVQLLDISADNSGQGVECEVGAQLRQRSVSRDSLNHGEQIGVKENNLQQVQSKSQGYNKEQVQLDKQGRDLRSIQDAVSVQSNEAINEKQSKFLKYQLSHYDYDDFMVNGNAESLYSSPARSVTTDLDNQKIDLDGSIASSANGTLTSLNNLNYEQDHVQNLVANVGNFTHEDQHAEPKRLSSIEHSSVEHRITSDRSQQKENPLNPATLPPPLNQENAPQLDQFGNKTHSLSLSDKNKANPQINLDKSQFQYYKVGDFVYTAQSPSMPDVSYQSSAKRSVDGSVDSSRTRSKNLGSVSTANKLNHIQKSSNNQYEACSAEGSFRPRPMPFPSDISHDPNKSSVPVGQISRENSKDQLNDTYNNQIQNLNQANLEQQQYQSHRQFYTMPSIPQMILPRQLPQLQQHYVLPAQQQIYPSQTINLNVDQCTQTLKQSPPVQQSGGSDQLQAEARTTNSQNDGIDSNDSSFQTPQSEKLQQKSTHYIKSTGKILSGGQRPSMYGKSKQQATVSKQRGSRNKEMRPGRQRDCKSQKSPRSENSRKLNYREFGMDYEGSSQSEDNDKVGQFKVGARPQISHTPTQNKYNNNQMQIQTTSLVQKDKFEAEISILDKVQQINQRHRQLISNSEQYQIDNEPSNKRDDLQATSGIQLDTWPVIDNNQNQTGSSSQLFRQTLSQDQIQQIYGTSVQTQTQLMQVIQGLTNLSSKDRYQSQNNRKATQIDTNNTKASYGSNDLQSNVQYKDNGQQDSLHQQSQNIFTEKQIPSHAAKKYKRHVRQWQIEQKQSNPFALGQLLNNPQQQAQSNTYSNPNRNIADEQKSIINIYQKNPFDQHVNYGNLPQQKRLKGGHDKSPGNDACIDSTSINTDINKEPFQIQEKIPIQRFSSIVPDKVSVLRKNRRTVQKFAHCQSSRWISRQSTSTEIRTGYSSGPLSRSHSAGSAHRNFNWFSHNKELVPDGKRYQPNAQQPIPSRREHMSPSPFFIQEKYFESIDFTSASQSRGHGKWRKHEQTGTSTEKVISTNRGSPAPLDRTRHKMHPYQRNNTQQVKINQQQDQIIQVEFYNPGKRGNSCKQHSPAQPGFRRKSDNGQVSSKQITRKQQPNHYINNRVEFDDKENSKMQGYAQSVAVGQGKRPSFVGQNVPHPARSGKKPLQQQQTNNQLLTSKQQIQRCYDQPPQLMLCSYPSDLQTELQHQQASTSSQISQIDSKVQQSQISAQASGDQRYLQNQENLSYYKQRSMQASKYNGQEIRQEPSDTRNIALYNGQTNQQVYTQGVKTQKSSIQPTPTQRSLEHDQFSSQQNTLSEQDHTDQSQNSKPPYTQSSQVPSKQQSTQQNYRSQPINPAIHTSQQNPEEQPHSMNQVDTKQNSSKSLKQFNSSKYNRLSSSSLVSSPSGVSSPAPTHTTMQNLTHEELNKAANLLLKYNAVYDNDSGSLFLRGHEARSPEVD